MSALSDLRDKLGRSKPYREAFAASVIKRLLPAQIRVLRRQRGWSQAQLAKESNLTQGAISRAEDPEYGNLTVNTLVRVAAGFDCAYIGRFVPFSELGRWYSMLSDERQLEVQSFDKDLGFVEHKQMGIASTISAGVIRVGGIGFGSSRPRHAQVRGNVIKLPTRSEAMNTRSYQHARRKKRTTVTAATA